MDNMDFERIGFLKFEGDAVADGTIGANAAGTALLAFDECLRFFNRKQSKGFANFPYEIPVQTSAGSWTVWLLGAAGLFGAAYLKKAAEKMAEADFKDVGFKDVLKKSLYAIKKLIELVKHTKGKLDLPNSRVEWKIREGLVHIFNDNGEAIALPLETFQWYLDIPPELLARLVQPVEEQRPLVIGVRSGENFDETRVTIYEKDYFGGKAQSDEDEFLFPELQHGDFVRLEGRLTRGNENTNSVGLEYRGHVLNCMPESGSITNYKAALFLRCVVEGTISRLTKASVADRRPTIIFRDIIPLEMDGQIRLL